MRHLDLFSGIGGFSLAFDRVFHEQKNDHIFVEWSDFCQEVLRRHWPEAEIHGDIDKFVADAKSRIEQQLAMERKPDEKISPFEPTYLITGGFPCQPFSAAGRRKGTADDRYKWPAMRDAIALFKPEWVIAENVAGLASWNDGLVLETVCADLEAQGYEVQPFVIPAVALNAPHRRDRIWIVAHSEQQRARYSVRGRHDEGTPDRIAGSDKKNATANTNNGHSRSIHFTRSLGGRSDSEEATAETPTPYSRYSDCSFQGWREPWSEVATHLCRVDDGVPSRLDRNSRLKALGNAIVPQVAEEIMKAIKNS